MTVAVKLDIKGIQPLLRALQQMGPTCTEKILVPAAKKGANVLVKSIYDHTPYDKKRKYGMHYRDSLTSVVRHYDMTKTVVAVVGPHSGWAPHSHLVEYGTGVRWTQHKTKYKRTIIRAREIIKNGRLKSVVEYQRKSIGSFAKAQRTYKDGSLKAFTMQYRGRMPAFHPIERGIEAAKAGVSAQLQIDIQKGIQREMTESQLRRGV